jgi:hypothetical protein
LGPIDWTKNTVPMTQENLYMNSSKDSQHIIRLAVLLQITSEYIRKFLNGNADADTENQITCHYLKKAQKLYGILVQQKSVFMQVYKVYSSGIIRKKIHIILVR